MHQEKRIAELLGTVGILLVTAAEIKRDIEVLQQDFDSLKQDMASLKGALDRIEEQRILAQSPYGIGHFGSTKDGATLKSDSIRNQRIFRLNSKTDT
ncbi:hypothetical protein [Effusibacillus lacus]|uniref:hypothetical protein n=1 Tax=Effusibacillus lacus TaxID=1348429 RepID=UPI000BB7A007|nr:hypothetical protein [Effusibacillus lacus]TCS75144.1 hypothetical protein EDD64_10969 [Effusibacillus lacus]